MVSGEATDASTIQKHLAVRRAQGMAEDQSTSGFTVPKKMVQSNQTAREIFEETINNPARKRFGFGQKVAGFTKWELEILLVDW